MKRRDFIGMALVALVSGSPAQADDFSDAVVDQLRGQGFKRIEIRRTFLGRVRILAEGHKGRREIILNPRTGEILRDLWSASEDSGSARNSRSDLIDNSNRGRGRGGDDLNEDEEEDDDAEDDDEDNSGKDSESDDSDDSDDGDDGDDE